MRGCESAEEASRLHRLYGLTFDLSGRRRHGALDSKCKWDEAPAPESRRGILLALRLIDELGAAAVQRSRIAVRTIEDALLTTEMFLGAIQHYHFDADTSGDMAAISMVSRLPASFPGVGRYGDQVVRRVSFYVSNSPAGGNELVMTQMPMLLDTSSGYEAYSLTLARDVTMFRLDFYNLQKNEWQDEWKDTNQLPRLVQVALGLGKHKGHSSEPQDVVTRLVSLPSVAVGGDIQGQGPRPGQQPGQPPGQLPGQLPGQPPGQPIFPGGGGIPPGAGGKRGGGIPR